MKLLLSIVFFISVTALHAQDVNLLMKEASNLEKQLNEQDALKKYLQVTELDPKNITALVKCTEFNCAIGARQKDNNVKLPYYNMAQSFAKNAYADDSTNADANYAMALVMAKLAEVADENKHAALLIRQTKFYADNAVTLNPNNARANYVLGKWHYDMINAAWIKKISKILYGGLPKADMDSAVYYMEKCRSIDQYFVRNYLDLAKAYQYNNRPSLALDVLKKLVKLPNRTADDAALKQEGQAMLDKMM